jgi:hypothetical protein
MLQYRTLNNAVHSDSEAQETDEWSTDKDESRLLAEDARTRPPVLFGPLPRDICWHIGPSALDMLFQYKTVRKRSHEDRFELILPGLTGWCLPHGFG